MKAITIYLNFNGNTEEAFNFYKDVFGGEFTLLDRFEITPGSEKMSSEDRKLILHVTLDIGNGVELMGSDVPSFREKVVPGSNAHYAIFVDSAEEADRIFARLSVGGKVTLPMADMFWGSYYGTVTDKFGINWMVDFIQVKTSRV